MSILSCDFIAVEEHVMERDLKGHCIQSPGVSGNCTT